MKKNNKQNFSIINTAIGGFNLGDQIIMDSCHDELHQIFSNECYFDIPWHSGIGGKTPKILKSSNCAILCGTNGIVSPLLIKPFFRSRHFYKLKNKVVLMGVGWGVYQNFTDPLTKKMLSFFLSKRHTHAVRDSYTMKKLHEIGIKNVVNTGCPTTWKLTNFESKKSDSVVTTITDYNTNNDADRKMFKILLEEYKNVYLWPQQIGDIKYFESLDINGVEVISSNLNAFNELLNNGNIDYVGTRLHAGIRSLQKHIKSIIIGIDNRAIEISNDIGIVVVKREEINNLSSVINSPYKTNIKLDTGTITQWRKQFSL